MKPALEACTWRARISRLARGVMVAVLLSGVGGSAAFAGSPVPAETWLFTSFHGNGDGLHLSASSDDGQTWTDLGRNFLMPTVGSKLLRDPHILRGPDGLFHMVWTTGWKDKGIGYASSPDLIHWSAQRYLPLMENVPGTNNVWAPETIYDAGLGRYVITWSSDVDGRFAQTRKAGQMNNRTYYVTTKDFKSFSQPKVLIDPGFDHIDTTIQKIGGRYVAVFKEGDNQERNRWGPIQWAVASKPLGPYRLMPRPLVSNERAEGPTLIVDGKRTRLYVDYYANGRYGAFDTTDWRTWQDVSDQVHVVKGQRHGTVFKVSKAVADKLRQFGPAS
jgi:hypothetical protein